MVLEKKQTTVAYRCPKCGVGIMSFVDAFKLNADMIKLKCDCKGSDLTIQKESDGKIRLSVPCIFCPKPHSYLLNPTIFYGKDNFYLSCPYTDFNIGFIGEVNHVKADLAKTELELLDIMEKSGIKDFSPFQEANEDELPDPEIQSIVRFVVGELEADGKIHCKCKDSYEGKYETIITNDGILVKCKDCGCERLVPTDNYLGAHTFLYTDDLYLE